MTLRHLHIFLAVCQNGCNTTRAAQALHLSQPAVSLALRELEGYYGVTLFDRMGRRLRITEAGKRLWESGAHIATLFDELENSLRDWDKLGLLRVGASVTIGSQFLPSYVKAFSAVHPGTQVRALVGPSERLERRLMDSELDLALVEGVVHSPSLVAEPYMEDELVVICPADGRFQADECIDQETFRRQPFLLREPGSGTREVFDRAVEAAGFSVAPIWEAMSTTALVNAVINGLGVAVLPGRLLTEPLRRGQVRRIHVEGLDFHRWFHMVWHRDKYLTPAALAFMDLCRRFEPDRPLDGA